MSGTRARSAQDSQHLRSREGGKLGGKERTALSRDVCWKTALFVVGSYNSRNAVGIFQTQRRMECDLRCLGPEVE
jgi:hypothetical protein